MLASAAATCDIVMSRCEPAALNAPSSVWPPAATTASVQSVTSCWLSARSVSTRSAVLIEKTFPPAVSRFTSPPSQFSSPAGFLPTEASLSDLKYCKVLVPAFRTKNLLSHLAIVLPRPFFWSLPPDCLSSQPSIFAAASSRELVEEGVGCAAP